MGYRKDLWNAAWPICLATYVDFCDWNNFTCQAAKALIEDLPDLVICRALIGKALERQEPTSTRTKTNFQSFFPWSDFNAVAVLRFSIYLMFSFQVDPTNSGSGSLHFRLPWDCLQPELREDWKLSCTWDPHGATHDITKLNLRLQEQIIRNFGSVASQAPSATYFLV